MKMSTLILAGASAAFLTFAASAASAQAGGGSGAGGMGSIQQQTGGPIGRMTADQQMSRFESEEQRRRHNPTPEEAEEMYGAERMDLARRVQALVDQGECRAARELANAEGDRNMALRVRQTCRAR